MVKQAFKMIKRSGKLSSLKSNTNSSRANLTYWLKSPLKYCHLLHPISWVGCIKIKSMGLLLIKSFSSARAIPMAALPNGWADAIRKIKRPSITNTGEKLAAKESFAAENYTQKERRKRGKREVLLAEAKGLLLLYWRTMEKPWSVWGPEFALVTLNQKTFPKLDFDSLDGPKW